MRSSSNPAFWRFSLATMLLASAYCYQLEALKMASHATGVSASSPSAARKLSQFVDGSDTTAPECSDIGAGYCQQERACLPGSYSLDTTPHCACCRPRGPVDPRVYGCGFTDCGEDTWGEARALPPNPYSRWPPGCIGKWMTCRSCPPGTNSPPRSDSSYDCKSFRATAPTCYELVSRGYRGWYNFEPVQPYPGMPYWPLNHTAFWLSRLYGGACANHGLPVQVCLGSNHWSGPNATLYQMWFVMEDGARMSPFSTAGTNRGNYVIGFMPTSNSTCKWAKRNSLFYIDGPNFEISGTEWCTVNNVTYPNKRRFKFAAPSQQYCTPSLVVV